MRETSQRVGVATVIAFSMLCSRCATRTPAAPASVGATDESRGSTSRERGARGEARESQGLREEQDTTPASENASPGASVPESMAAFDLDVWARDHGIVVDLKVDGCEIARLGEKPDETLWCYRHEELPGARVLYYRALYTLAGRHLVRVAELPYAAGPFAAEGQSSPPRTVELAAKVAPDGKSVALEELPGKSCDDARAAHDKALEDEPLGAPEFAKLIERVCASRGRYVWRGGALTKGP